MYLLHRKKNGIYTNISLFLSYSEVTVVTRSSLYPDQMVDQHLEMTSTALNVSGDQNNSMSPRDRSPVKTLSPRRPSGPREPDESSAQTAGSSGQRRTGPPTEPGFSQCFVLHSVTDRVLVPCRCRLWLA